MTATTQLNPFACGWFQVDYSDQLRPGEVRPFHAFDLAEILFIDGITVRGERELDLNFSLMARLSGVRSPDMSLELVNEAIRQVSEDVPIWRHKARWERPSLATGDGPIMKFRRWAAQFTPITGATAANTLELTHV